MNAITAAILVIGAVVALSFICSDGHEGVQLSTPIDSGKELVIPSGYEFVDASAFGNFQIVTYYLKETKSGRIYKSDGRKITGEVAVPAGYTFIGASAYGASSCVTTYYIMSDTNGKIYKA